MKNNKKTKVLNKKNKNDETFYVMSEIPKDSSIKYEFDHLCQKFVIDRILGSSNAYPENYGFFPQTLDFDGDPLDVIVISNHSFQPGMYVDVRPIGIIIMLDDGDLDNKILSVAVNDPEFAHCKSIKDISKPRILKILDFFTNYKKIEKKQVKILGIKEAELAYENIKESITLFNKYKDQILNTEKYLLVKILKRNENEIIKKFINSIQQN